MDLAPADVMLISRHRDRPGTVGRVGAMLGEADVNISSMTLARSAPRADAFMVLALDDDVPDTVVRAIESDDAVIDVWVVRLDGPGDGDPAGPSEPPRPSSPRVSTRRSSCSATASRSGSSRTGSRASPRPRSPRGAAPGARWPASGSPRRTTARPAGSRTAGRWRSCTRRSPWAAADRRLRRAIAIERGAWTACRGSRRVPDAGSSSSGRASGRALHQEEIAAHYPDVLPGWRRRPWEAWAPGGESLASVQARVRSSLGDVLERLGRDYPRGTPGPAAGRRLRGRRSRGRPAVDGDRGPRRRVQGHPADPVRACPSPTSGCSRWG